MPRIARRKGDNWDIEPGGAMQVLATHQQGRVVGTIAMCTRDKISAPTAISWLLSDQSFLKPGEVVSRQIVQGHILTQQRNECVQRLEGDWILFIDDDMTWQPNAIKTLVETREKFDLDILGGLCFQRGAPYQPTMYYADPTGGYLFREGWDEDAAIEVDATGMAFVIIHARVFDAILRQRTGEGFPSFQERQFMPPPPFFRWEGELGEDFLFCKEAKEAGCRVFVDTSVKIGHIGEHVITQETFLRELATRPPEILPVRRQLNDRLGLPTVTQEEALQILRSLSSPPPTTAPTQPSSPSPSPQETSSPLISMNRAGRRAGRTTSGSGPSGRSTGKTGRTRR